MAYKGEGKWLREAPLSERLAFRSKRNPRTGCILWLGSLKYTDGYGRIGVNGKTVGAHVVAYILAKGPIPKGLELDHLCRVRHCINPDHLEAVTHSVNVLRGAGRDRLGSWQRSKTRCPKGHLYKGENLFLNGAGDRCCRICSRRWARIYRNSKRRNGNANHTYQ